MRRGRFGKSLEELLQIRRPEPSQPFGYDVRGSFRAVVQPIRFQLNTELRLNITERRFNVSVAQALPLSPIADSNDALFEKDLREGDQLIRLKFHSESEIDTEMKLKNIQGNVLEVVSLDVARTVTAIECKETGSL